MVEKLSKAQLRKIPMFHTAQHEWYKILLDGEDYQPMIRWVKKQDKKLDKKYFRTRPTKVVFGLSERISFEKRMKLTSKNFAKACMALSSTVVFFLYDKNDWKYLDSRVFSKPIVKTSIKAIRSIGIDKSFKGGLEPSRAKLSQIYKNLGILTHYIGGFEVGFIDRDGRFAGGICDEGNPHIDLYHNQYHRQIKRAFKGAGFSNTNCRLYAFDEGRKILL